MTVNHVKLEPGSDRHLTLLGAPMHLNLLVGQDRVDMLAFGHLVWQASRQQALEESRVLCVWIADDWECAGMKDKASAATYLAESIRSLATRPTPTKGPTP